MKLWIRWFVGLTVVATLVVAYPLSEASAHVRNGALLGWCLAFAVSASGGLLAFRSLRLSQPAFLIVTFGGMFLRLVVVALVVVYAVAFAGVHVIAFLVGLFGPYTMYHALEMILLHRHRPAPHFPATAVEDERAGGTIHSAGVVL